MKCAEIFEITGETMPLRSAPVAVADTFLTAFPLRSCAGGETDLADGEAAQDPAEAGSNTL